MHYLDPIPPNDPALLPPATQEPDDRKSAAVDILDVLLVLCVTFVALVFCPEIGKWVFLAWHGSPKLSSSELTKTLEHNVFFLLPMQLVVYAVVVGFMAFLVWARHRTGLGRAIGWNTPKLGRAFAALLGGVMLAFLAGVAQVLLDRWIPKSLPITEFFKDRSSALALAAFGIMVAPLVEELFFRGFLYPALARWTGVAPAVAVTAALFALLHEGQLARAWVPLLVLFVVGAVITVVRAASKSVAACVLIHMAYNFTLFALAYIGTNGFRKFAP